MNGSTIKTLAEMVSSGDIELKPAVIALLQSQVEILERLRRIESEQSAWKNRAVGYLLASLGGGGITAAVIKFLS